MTAENFMKSIDDKCPPTQLSVQLQALWWEAKGNWKKAHDLIDHLDDPVSAHIHAYLHRVEGDLWNARYWYNRANKNEFKGTLEEERHELITTYCV